MCKPNPLGLTDGYKPGHRLMLAPGTEYLYGTWIPRSLKHAAPGIEKIMSAGQQLSWMWLHDQFEENFFNEPIEVAKKFGRDLSKYQGLPYDSTHFEDLHKLGYLPLEVKALPEGCETNPNIPHQTFVNTVPGYAWLTLYLETPVSYVSWKTPTNATLALQYRRNATEWVMKTDSDNAWFIDYCCHDFASRGLDPFSVISSGLAHSFSFIGSDTLIVIDAARYYYGVGEDDVCIASVNASEHSVTCTGLFYFLDKLQSGELDAEIDEYYSYDIPATKSTRENPDLMAIAEWLNLKRWLEIFPVGILSVVSDTFDLFRVITEILPRLKDQIMSRDGKLVVRPDSGDPVDITCGTITENTNSLEGNIEDAIIDNRKDGFNGLYPYQKGVIELLWDVFGGTVNEQGYKVLDPHIGAIYGDSITIDRANEICKRLEAKGFASTNVVLGVGSFTYQYNTRDTFGFAMKATYVEVKHWDVATERLNGSFGKNANPEWVEGREIFKDPVTDDGTKKSATGLLSVHNHDGEYVLIDRCTWEGEEVSSLQTIYKDGEFSNEITLSEIRETLAKQIELVLEKA